MTTAIRPIPIPQARQDGTLDPKELESWRRNVFNILNDLAREVASVMVAGDGMTITLGTLTVTITLNKIAISADAAAMTATTVAGTAGATYTSTEQNMINDLKAQYNKLLTDVTSVRTALNDLKAKARTAKHLAV